MGLLAEAADLCVCRNAGMAGHYHQMRRLDAARQRFARLRSNARRAVLILRRVRRSRRMQLHGQYFLAIATQEHMRQRGGS